MKRSLRVWSMLSAVLILIACLGRLKLVGATANGSADQLNSNWLMYGLTSDDHRFSPLKQIDEQTVGKLGLVWSEELDTTRGLEATPIVEDGVIYTTGSWNVVIAMDAKTGKTMWKYDPALDRSGAYFICCDTEIGRASCRERVYGRV